MRWWQYVLGLEETLEISSERLRINTFEGAFDVFPGDVEAMCISTERWLVPVDFVLGWIPFPVENYHVFTVQFLADIPPNLPLVMLTENEFHPSAGYTAIHRERVSIDLHWFRPNVEGSGFVADPSGGARFEEPLDHRHRLDQLLNN